MRPGLLLRGALAGLAVLAVMPGAMAKDIHVAIDKLAFVPAEITAAVGDTVEWESSDFVAHTATARDKRWDIAIPAKGSGRVTLDRAGVIDYYCRFHPNMMGRITVVGK